MTVCMGYATVAGGQTVGDVLPKYDVNGDGFVNVQDANEFVAALAAGYFTVQDINPFLAEIAKARPTISLYVPHGMVYYIEPGLPEQTGLDPEKPYIVCREVQVVGGVAYVVTSSRQFFDVAVLCTDTGYTRAEVTLVVVPTP